MFVVTNEQMKILASEMARSFAKRMAGYLREYFPPQTKELSDAEMGKLVDRGVAQAARYGVVDEEDVQHYLEYMMRFGRNFDQDPALDWAGSILRAKDVDGARKMRRIANRLRLMDEGLL